jgi:hypothetical protein
VAISCSSSPSVITRITGSVPEDPCELYCQVLEHKWFLSEQEQRDVGHQRALEGYLELKRAREELGR